MQRGARVFEVTMNPYSIKTWVRQEDGTVRIENKSKTRGIFDFAQTKCGGALGKALKIDPHDVELQYLREYYLRRSDLQHLVLEKEKLHAVQE